MYIQIIFWGVKLVDKKIIYFKLVCFYLYNKVNEKMVNNFILQYFSEFYNTELVVCECIVQCRN